ncbi:MAG: beta-ketoacyl-ACP synthase II [Simkaniaceae bacterium]
MAKKKRVVVTGLGLVSCFGQDVRTFYEALLQGKSGIGPIESFPCEDYPTRFAGSVQNFNTEGYLDKKQARRTDPCIQYTLVAGKRAIEDAQLDDDSLQKLDRTRCGVLVGSGMGGMKTFGDGVNTVYQKGFNRLTPFFIPYVITNMGSALLGMELGFQGPNYSISTACATANYAITAAARHIQSGEVDLMVCGGSEAPLTPMGVAGFVVIKALSTRNDEYQTASRPWDKTRDGFVMGEGSGILVLESLEHALERGAPIYAEYLGGAFSCDAYHMTAPREDGQGVKLCIEQALKEAEIEKHQINYINAHATSTPVGDLCEVRAVRDVFLEHSKNISMNSTKSMTGHCLGAAGGIEAIATVMAIKTSKIHPTINILEPEDEIKNFDYVPDVAKEKKITAALSNSFGFGGHNSSLIFGPYTGF